MLRKAYQDGSGSCCAPLVVARFACGYSNWLKRPISYSKSRIQAKSADYSVQSGSQPGSPYAHPSGAAPPGTPGLGVFDWNQTNAAFPNRNRVSGGRELKKICPGFQPSCLDASQSVRAPQVSVGVPCRARKPAMKLQELRNLQPSQVATRASLSASKRRVVPLPEAIR